jgi:hypothetical protein
MDIHYASSVDIVSSASLVCVAAILLLYPIKTGEVHPVVQIAVCASLSAVGLYMGMSAIFVGKNWVLLASILLSLTTVVVPAIGALIGLSTAAGLITYAISASFCSSSVTFWLVILGTIGGAASLFVEREMFLYWQLIAPPIVGGYLLSNAMAELMNCSALLMYAVWTVAAAVSIVLHIRRRRYNTWLERKKDIAVHSKESQIVNVMRSANPDMQPDEFEKLKERLLGAVGGDREQVDRIVFGGGLY